MGRGPQNVKGSTGRGLEYNYDYFAYVHVVMNCVAASGGYHRH